MRACVRVFECGCACVRACVHVCMHACVCVVCLSVWGGGGGGGGGGMECSNVIVWAVKKKHFLI